MKKRFNRKSGGLVVLAAIAGFVWLAVTLRQVARDRSSNPAAALTSLSALLVLPAEALERVDLGRMNLLCAQGLPGSKDLDVNLCLARLDAMAARVRTETERHYYRFQRDPAGFENSEGFFRMIMLAVVLGEDFQVQYAPDKIGNSTDARPGDGFFADAHDVFLHGLTGAKPLGTCSSLPVLQVAVGRRLGYPLKLVTTRGHLFVRWEDARERLNIEAAGSGVSRFSDDYYRQWPVPVSEDEIKAEGYLKSLSPTEELAVFLSIRGMCWSEAGRYGEAAKSFGTAARLAPGVRSYGVLAEEMRSKAVDGISGAVTRVVRSEL